MANESLVTQPKGELLSDEILQPVMSLALAKKRLQEFQEFVKEYLKENEDFGIIPGTPKPTLLKPGADKLCELYGLSDSYEIVDKIEDWEAQPPLFDYTVRCILTRIRTQLPVASGLGSCSTYESKYKYRDSKRKCPKCGRDTIIKGKEEYGGGWLCFARKGGCGEKFSDGDASIEKQVIGRIVNEDIVDQKNTVLKIAKKRAKVDAALSATRSSGVFTQDVEDMDIGSSGAPSQGDKGKPSQTPTNAPKGKSGARKSAPAQDENLDVICNQCGGKNRHEKDCPTINKQQAAQAPVKKTVELYVDDVKVEKTKVVVKDGKQTGGREYVRLVCLDRDNNPVPVFVFHATPMKHAAKWKELWATIEVTEKPGKEGMIMSLDNVLKVGSVSYHGNEPVVEADVPTSADLGFDEPQE